MVLNLNKMYPSNKEKFERMIEAFDEESNSIKYFNDDYIILSKHAKREDVVVSNTIECLGETT